MLKSSETVNALVRAKEQIGTPRKWSHGSAHKRGGRVCLMVALNRQNQHLCTAMAAWEAVRQAITYLYPERITQADPCRCGAVFNDHPDTTHADVMRVFDEAIHTAE